MYDLVKGLFNDDAEDSESARVAMLEILDQKPLEVCRLPEVGIGDELQKWVDFVGGKIKELRKKFNLTQEKLAELAGIPQSHVSRLENGKHSPSHVTIEKLATALGVEASELDPSL